jgi:hypothetical protein
MPDVKDLDFTPALHKAIDDTIHMWLATVKKLSKIFVLRRPWAPQRIGFQSKYGPLQSVEPSKSTIRVFGVNSAVKVNKIALGAWHDPN